ncbi:CopG family transcriptional regulator [Clostridia bacterium]|nr:CopG family transcriptional regulator [Clostridia bacterium]
MTESKRILVSLPNTLLDEVDGFAGRSGTSRSELIRVAMREFVQRRKKLDVDERLKVGYQLMAAINLELVELCAAADCKQQFEYEEKLSECE